MAFPSQSPTGTSSELALASREERPGGVARVNDVDFDAALTSESPPPPFSYFFNFCTLRISPPKIVNFSSRLLSQG